MSLIEQMMEPCVIMNKSKVSDGEGGYSTSWTPGAEILAAIVNDSSTQAQIAEAQGVTSTYTLTTTKANALEYHEVIKRLKDGKVFRVTSDPDDKLSPASSSFDIAQVKAEKWSLT